MDRQVPFFNYPFLYQSIKDELLPLMDDVMSRGAFILQRDLEAFERNAAAFLGVKHFYGVADGTNAILLLLRAAGIGPGDEVVLPSHTYVATAAAVHYVGATPVLVECGRDHMIAPESAEQAITPRTKAIMPVQLNGRTADMDRIRDIAGRHGLLIVEDAAQAFGSRFRGQSAGSFGVGGSFSFYPAKLLGSFGDAGGVITNDDAIAEKLFLLRDHGRNRDGEVVGWGTNCRLDNLQAAILDLKLKYYQADIERRRAIAQRYQNNLGDLPQLLLPPAPGVDERHFDVYQNYEIEAERRDELKAFLGDHGVRTLIQWGGKPVHKLAGLGFEQVSLPATEAMFTRCLMLPMNTSLGDDDVDYVSETIRRFYRG